MISLPNKLEFHYFFNDESHTMDAHVRHKCEAEILLLLADVAQQLGMEISIEIEPAGEGGLIDFYKVTWKNLETSSKIGVIGLSFTAIGLLLTATNIILSRNPASTISPEQEQVNLDLSKLQLKKARREDSITTYLDHRIIDSLVAFNDQELTKRLEEESKKIKKSKKGEKNTEKGLIKLESKKLVPVTDKLEVYRALNDQTDEIFFAEVLNQLEISPSINRHRSNFFKTLKRYEKVTHISTTPLNENNTPYDEPVTILRENFGRYVIETDEIPNEIDQDATIEIIAPVLLKSRYKWKGFYKGGMIEFYMKDDVFKNGILNKNIYVTGGMALDCVLEIKRKSDEIGNTYVAGYAVTNVKALTDGTARTEIPKRAKKPKKTHNPDQIDLFQFDDDELEGDTE